MAKKFNTTLVKDALLNQQEKLRKEEVDLTEELGVKVWVRELSGTGLLEYKNFLESLGPAETVLTTEQSLHVMAKMVSLTACDEQGSLILTFDEAKTMIEGSLTVLRKLSAKANELSGFGKALDEEVAANLKNEESSPSMES